MFQEWLVTRSKFKSVTINHVCSVLKIESNEEYLVHMVSLVIAIANVPLNERTLQYIHNDTDIKNTLVNIRYQFKVFHVIDLCSIEMVRQLLVQNDQLHNHHQLLHYFMVACIAACAGLVGFLTHVIKK